MPDAIPEQLLEHIAERFRVLGDVTRLSILRLLLDHGELNVGELSELCESSQANVSKHLKMLNTARIVVRRPVGTAAYYSVADPSISRLCTIVCDQLRLQVAEEARTFANA
ncbi:MAG: metalloregulator ArsR/SmtB family transcription factor [Tepidiformaceae bacterium]